ncbi:hypothetical protein Tco_1239437, partial [Tanacetum coccineum]
EFAALAELLKDNNALKDSKIIKIRVSSAFPICKLQHYASSERPVTKEH